MFQRRSQAFGIAVSKVLSQDQKIAALLDRSLGHIHEPSLVRFPTAAEPLGDVGRNGNRGATHLRSEAEALFGQALARGRAEGQPPGEAPADGRPADGAPAEGRSRSRPLATAEALQAAGQASYERGLLDLAREFFTAALSLQASRAPGSLARESRRAYSLPCGAAGYREILLALPNNKSTNQSGKREVKNMSDIADRVRKIVVEHLNVDAEKVTEKASFIDDLGADSLDQVELVMAFEEEFSVEIPDDAAESIQTFGGAVAFLTKAVG